MRREIQWLILNILSILLIFVAESEFQIISLCEIPEKNSRCTLKCRTKDYTIQPVTFSHPPNRDVGSCIPQVPCLSNYERYSLSQRKIGQANITEFHIDKLNRNEDQGEWICSYGNTPSQAVSLFVHTRPVTVKINVTQTTTNEGGIVVECMCACIYPSDSTFIEIQISNEIREIKRRLAPLQHLNIEVNNCEKHEQTAIGSYKIDQNNWEGRFININCICTESKLRHTQTEKLRYIFQGVPERPENVKVDSITSNSVMVKWQKGSNEGDIQSFVILYRPANINDTFKNVTLQEEKNKSHYNTTIRSLIPDSAYNVLIYATNSKGKSKIVGPLSFKTLKESKDVAIYWKILIPPICFVIPTLLTVVCMKKPKIPRHIVIWISYVISVLIMLVLAFVASLTLSIDVLWLKVGLIILISVILATLPGIVFGIILCQNWDKKCKWCRGKTKGLEESGQTLLPLPVTKDKVPRAVSDTSKVKIDNESEILGDISKMNIANTKALIIRLKNSGFFETTSYEEGHELLKKEGVLIYKGISGDGRFTNAIHLIDRWMREQEYQPVLIQDITKWDSVVNPNLKMIVLIPDILSRVTIDKKLYEKAYPYWEKMMSCVSCGKTKIIMTCQGKIINDIWQILRDYDIFNEKHHIDLSNEQYRLTKEEKIAIFITHFKKNNIEICKEREAENYKETKEDAQDSVIRISETTVEKIANTEPLMGYPQSCTLFCKHRKYLRLGVGFFLRPSKFLVDDIDDLNNSDDKCKTMKYEILKELWYKDPETVSFNDTKYDRALYELKNIYIEKNIDGKYGLKHDTIYSAVGLSICKRNPKSVIEECNWNFLRYCTKSVTLQEQDEEGDVLLVTEDLRKVLIKRCLNDLTSDSLYRYSKYVSECWKGFVSDILDEIDENPEKSNILKESCCKDKGIFEIACTRENIEGVRELLARYTISQDMLHHCYNACKNDEIRSMIERKFTN